MHNLIHGIHQLVAESDKMKGMQQLSKYMNCLNDILEYMNCLNDIFPKKQCTTDHKKPFKGGHIFQFNFKNFNGKLFLCLLATITASKLRLKPSLKKYTQSFN